MSWSSSDKYFVNSKLEVFTVDLFSESLELTQSEDVIYDGPKSDDFKRFLRSKNLRVNRQGKAIVRVEKRDDDGGLLEAQYETFILERVFPLDSYGFQNVPLPKPQAVNELQCLLDNSNAEMAKQNDELHELQSLLDNSKVELEKKNDALDELQNRLDNTNAELTKKNDSLGELQNLLDSTKSELAKKVDELFELKKQRIDQEWNPEQFRLTLVAITNSMKRVFVHFGLEPPASGDPESVLKFLEKLNDLILRQEFEMLNDQNLHKEFDTAFLVAANGTLASIATIFEKRTGLRIGIETTVSSSTTRSRAHLIENLLALRSFMVDSHFFIDGSVMVRDFRLINEDELPAIFRDSATDVAELKLKDMGAKSIDNIDGKSIFYGYFNIPKVGMFKGILTRIHVNLPDEIMVKLRVGGQQNLISDKRFWFVNANGAGIFQKDEEPINLEDIRFKPSRTLGDSTNFFEFLLRMNRTFVNRHGTYLKFDFGVGVIGQVLRPAPTGIIQYRDKDFDFNNPLKLVQFDTNSLEQEITKREFFMPSIGTSSSDKKEGSWIVNEAVDNADKTNHCCFYNDNYRFIGTIKKVSGTFRHNALVSVFFEQSQHGANCYVDALATTFFVLNDQKQSTWINPSKSAPAFI